MASKLTVFVALLALVSHVLVAVALATNWWLTFRPASAVVLPAGAAAANGSREHPLNPLRNDSGLGDIELRYRAAHLGVWVACFRELDFGEKTACGFIDAKCDANVCWVRNGKERTCARNRVAALGGKCLAFQVVRAFAVVGTFCSVIGTVFLFVALCALEWEFERSGAVCTISAGMFLMVTFAVFLGAVVNAGGVRPVAFPSWSYALCVAAWVIALVAGAVACAATAGPRDDKASTEFEESEGEEVGE